MNENKTDLMAQLMDVIGRGISSFIIGFGKNLKHCYYGYQNNLIPFQRLVLLSVCFSLFWSLKLDVTLIKLIHMSFPKFGLSPPVGFVRLLFWLITVIAPFQIWGASHRNIEQAILKYLRDVFESVGLKNNDKYPNLIREYVTDSGSRKLQLFSDGIVVEQYVEKLSMLENKLGVKIESIKQHPQLAKVIEIELADGEMPMAFNLDNIFGYKDFTFPVGKTRSEVVVGDLKKVPHYLFAGMTGKGKSTFIKTMISVLLANNKNLEVRFIDLKGTEATEFDGHSKVVVATELKTACKEITAIDQLILDRRNSFLEAEVKDIEAFNQKAIKPDSKVLPLNRVVVVVDEIAQITPTLATEEHALVKDANLILNRIARMGRSFGIHLIVGVQKPDTKNLDSTIKSNLEGILCFQVANRTQSQVVLDSNKASHLNSIPGRAIWQVGGEDRVVQAPYLTRKQIEFLNQKEKNDRSRKSEKPTDQAVGRERSPEANQTYSEEGTAFSKTNQ